MYRVKLSIGRNLFTVRMKIDLNEFDMFFGIFLESGDKNISPEENDLDDKNGEVGGLFHVSQRKKINVNDQEDYTLNQQNEKHDWDLDEVCEEKLF